MNSMLKKRHVLPLYALAIAAALAFTFQQGALPETVRPVVDGAPTNYNWVERHNAVVDRVKKGNVDLLLIGDSIMHMWSSATRWSRRLSVGEILWKPKRGEPRFWMGSYAARSLAS